MLSLKAARGKVAAGPLLASAALVAALATLVGGVWLPRRLPPTTPRSDLIQAGAGPSGGSASAPELAPFSDAIGDGFLSFHRHRLRADSDDVVSLNAVAGAVLERLRLTGNLVWLREARDLTERSLQSVPAEANPDALKNQARVETEYHHFGRARDLAGLLCKRQPSDPSGFEILGDALVELGEYDLAKEVYRDLQNLFPEAQPPPPEVAIRVARLDWINGDAQSAVRGYSAALTDVERNAPAFVEMQAFCLVQLGQLAFERGDWKEARADYTRALRVLPSYLAAYEHLAEVTGAEGDYPLASAMYERLISRIDRPEFAQMLADLYLYTQSPSLAEPWRRQAERGYQESIARGDTFYLHNLVSFYSDTAMDADKAVHFARLDLENVHSVFAFEALGWALYRQGNYPEAKRAFDCATVRKTPSAHLDYEAGTAYFRAGDFQKGQEFLRATYALNPAFDSFHVHR